MSGPEPHVLPLQLVVCALDEGVLHRPTASYPDTCPQTLAWATTSNGAECADPDATGQMSARELDTPELFFSNKH